VRALRGAGHDVVAICEETRAVDDDVIIAQASAELRIVITEDRDFGRLVYVRGAGNHGVIYTRFGARARAALPGAVLDVVARFGDSLAQAFTVVQPGRVRVRRTPGPA
jgi:hypothetical protein